MTYDLSDPTLLFTEEFIEDPAPLYAQLRAEAPVWELPGTKTFLVSSAALVAEVVGRTEDFSSNLTSLLFTGDDGRPTVFDMTQLGPGTHVLATADPPVHTAHRKLMQPLFAPKALDALDQFVDDAARSLVHQLVDAGRGDFAPLVAEPLPVQVICAMVGVPAEDAAMLEPLVLRSGGLLAGVTDPETMAASVDAAMRVSTYLSELLSNWVPSADGTTVCDHAVAAIEAGDITLEDAHGMITQLLGAGTDTTTSLIGRAAIHLARHPELQAELRQDLARVPTFLEEMLRYDGPFRFHYRSVPRDTHLGGVAIPAGSRLMVMWGAANLDDDYFDHADSFDPARAALRSHFAFGRGIHFCIGAPLARLEAKRAIEQLLRQTAHFEIDPERSPAFHRTIFVRRPRSVPLVVTAS